MIITGTHLWYKIHWMLISMQLAAILTALVPRSLVQARPFSDSRCLSSSCFLAKGDLNVAYVFYFQSTLSRWTVTEFLSCLQLRTGTRLITFCLSLVSSYISDGCLSFWLTLYYVHLGYSSKSVLESSGGSNQQIETRMRHKIKSVLDMSWGLSSGTTQQYFTHNTKHGLYGEGHDGCWWLQWNSVLKHAYCIKQIKSTQAGWSTWPITWKASLSHWFHHSREPSANCGERNLTFCVIFLTEI